MPPLPSRRTRRYLSPITRPAVRSARRRSVSRPLLGLLGAGDRYLHHYRGHYSASLRRPIPRFATKNAKGKGASRTGPLAAGSSRRERRARRVARGRPSPGARLARLARLCSRAARTDARVGPARCRCFSRVLAARARPPLGIRVASGAAPDAARELHPLQPFETPQGGHPYATRKSQLAPYGSGPRSDRVTRPGRSRCSDVRSTSRIAEGDRCGGRRAA